MSPKYLKFRFLLDENCPTQVSSFLKSLGHNTKSTIELKNIRGESDLSQLKYAIKEDRILISLDKDFDAHQYLLGLIRKSPGVLLIRSSNPISDKIILILGRQLKKISVNKIKNNICIITTDQIFYK